MTEKASGNDDERFVRELISSSDWSRIEQGMLNNPKILLTILDKWIKEKKAKGSGEVREQFLCILESMHSTQLNTVETLEKYSRNAACVEVLHNSSRSVYALLRMVDELPDEDVQDGDEDDETELITLPHEFYLHGLMDVSLFISRTARRPLEMMSQMKQLMFAENEQRILERRVPSRDYEEYKNSQEPYIRSILDVQNTMLKNNQWDSLSLSQKRKCFNLIAGAYSNLFVLLAYGKIAYLKSAESKGPFDMRNPLNEYELRWILEDNPMSLFKASETWVQLKSMSLPRFLDYQDLDLLVLVEELKKLRMEFLEIFDERMEWKECNDKQKSVIRHFVRNVYRFIRLQDADSPGDSKCSTPSEEVSKEPCQTSSSQEDKSNVQEEVSVKSKWAKKREAKKKRDENERFVRELISSSDLVKIEEGMLNNPKIFLKVLDKWIREKKAKGSGEVREQFLRAIDEMHSSTLDVVETLEECPKNESGQELLLYVCRSVYASLKMVDDLPDKIVHDGDEDDGREWLAPPSELYLHDLMDVRLFISRTAQRPLQMLEQMKQLMITENGKRFLEHRVPSRDYEEYNISQESYAKSIEIVRNKMGKNHQWNSFTQCQRESCLRLIASAYCNLVVLLTSGKMEYLKTAKGKGPFHMRKLPDEYELRWILEDNPMSLFKTFEKWESHLECMNLARFDDNEILVLLGLVEECKNLRMECSEFLDERMEWKEYNDEQKSVIRDFVRNVFLFLKYARLEDSMLNDVPKTEQTENPSGDPNHSRTIDLRTHPKMSKMEEITGEDEPYQTASSPENKSNLEDVAVKSKSAKKREAKKRRDERKRNEEVVEKSESFENEKSENERELQKLISSSNWSGIEHEMIKDPTTLLLILDRCIKEKEAKGSGDARMEILRRLSYMHQCCMVTLNQLTSDPKSATYQEELVHMSRSVYAGLKMIFDLPDKDVPDNVKKEKSDIGTLQWSFPLHELMKVGDYLSLAARHPHQMLESIIRLMDEERTKSSIKTHLTSKEYNWFEQEKEHNFKFIDRLRKQGLVRNNGRNILAEWRRDVVLQMAAVMYQNFDVLLTRGKIGYFQTVESKGPFKLRQLPDPFELRWLLEENPMNLFQTFEKWVQQKLEEQDYSDEVKKYLEDAKECKSLRRECLEFMNERMEWKEYRDNQQSRIRKFVRTVYWFIKTNHLEYSVNHKTRKPKGAKNSKSKLRVELKDIELNEGTSSEGVSTPSEDVGSEETFKMEQVKMEPEEQSSDSNPSESLQNSSANEKLLVLSTNTGEKITVNVAELLSKGQYGEKPNFENIIKEMNWNNLSPSSRQRCHEAVLDGIKTRCGDSSRIHSEEEQDLKRIAEEYRMQLKLTEAPSESKKESLNDQKPSSDIGTEEVSKIEKIDKNSDRRPSKDDETEDGSKTEKIDEYSNGKEPSIPKPSEGAQNSSTPEDLQVSNTESEEMLSEDLLDIISTVTKLYERRPSAARSVKTFCEGVLRELNSESNKVMSSMTGKIDEIPDRRPSTDFGTEDGSKTTKIDKKSFKKVSCDNEKCVRLKNLYLQEQNNRTIAEGELKKNKGKVDDWERMKKDEEKWKTEKKKMEKEMRTMTKTIETLTIQADENEKFRKMVEEQAGEIRRLTAKNRQMEIDHEKLKSAFKKTANQCAKFKSDLRTIEKSMGVILREVEQCPQSVSSIDPSVVQRIDWIRKLKRDFEDSDVVNGVRNMTEVLCIKTPEFELSMETEQKRLETYMEMYSRVLDYNLQILEDTKSIGCLLPVPIPPQVSPRFVERFNVEFEKLFPSKKKECLICYENLAEGDNVYICANKNDHVVCLVCGEKCLAKKEGDGKCVLRCDARMELGVWVHPERE